MICARRVLGALMLAALLASCSRSGERSPPTELRLAVAQEPHSLATILAQSITENELLRLIADPLIACDAAGHPVPALAVAVPSRMNGGISADGLRLTYRLRHGVVWHDGTPFTSADVAASFRAVMDPRNPVQTRHGYDAVARVETPDRYTVRFALKYPFAPFVGTVFAESDAPYYLAPAHRIHGALARASLATAPIGTGPYKVVRWSRGDRLELAANDAYWAGTPAIPRIIVRFIPNENSELVALRSGDIDGVIGLSAAAAAGVATIAHVRVTTAPLNAYFGIMMNTARGPMRNVRLRHAIAEAVDAASFRANITHGYFAPTITDLPLALWATDRKLHPIPHDPADARRLLAAAGYGPAHHLALELATVATSQTHRAESVALQSELRALGVDVTIHPYFGNVPIAFLGSPVAISALRDDLDGFAPSLVTQTANAPALEVPLALTAPAVRPCLPKGTFCRLAMAGANSANAKHWKSMIRRITVVLLTAFLGSASLAVGQTAAPPPAPAVTPQPAATPAAKAGPSEPPAPAATLAPSPSEPSTAPIGTRPSPAPSGSALPFPGLTIGNPQSYASFSKGSTAQPGVIDLIRKDDELYFDLKPENFDRTYVILPSIERGVGSGAFAGRVYDPLQVTFKRVGKRVLWITPNTRYVAEKGSAAANSLAISVADSVILSTPIVAEDTDKKHTVVSPSIFLTDFEGIGAELGRGAAPPSLPGLLIIGVRPSFAVDPSKSYYGPTKAFPRNDEISVNLAFNGPPNALPTVPDGRGIPVVVHYSIVAPPDRDPRFVPRFADDRVGYFITARRRYGNDAAATPFERFIERWNLDNGPITFYLTNEIPVGYRATVRRAILAWNDAFAKIGHPNAIVVKDPPSDRNWDPDDARYTTVRWITSVQPDFSAYSPHISDPDTGQIIRAEVVIDGESMRDVKRGYIERVAPAQRARHDMYSTQTSTLGDAAQNGDGDGTGDSDAGQCAYQEGSVAQAALGTLMLAQNPRATAADRERYAQAWLYAMVLHEVGHTLGLRHNFRGSTAYSLKQLHDPAFTRAHGTTASVMDYTPANLAPPGTRQADYFPTKLGVYDYWAIDYGYRRFPNVHSSADERTSLARIASRSTEPGLEYGTDEDATQLSIDPRIQPWDLSSDPLGYVDEQLRVDENVVRGLSRRFPGDTRSYQDLRQGLITVLEDELTAGVIASKYVGGIYTSRAHRGEPGAPLPFTSISRAEQRRAFGMIDRAILSSSALRLPPELLNAAAPSRFGIHWGANRVVRQDFPIREVIAELQDDVISEIFSPANLARVADQEIKVRRPGDTMTLADLFAWTNAAVFDDVGRSSIAPTHRELQRRFADLEMQIAALPSVFADQLGLPRETQALARYQLTKLDGRFDHAIAVAGDDGTRAHLIDLRVRVRGLLHAQNIRAI